VTSADTDTPDDIAAPETGPAPRLQAAYAQYEQDVRDAENAGDAMRICLDAAEEFAAIEVDVEDETTAHSMAKALLNQLCDSKSGVARKNVRAHWLDTIEEMEREQAVEDGERVIFSELIKNHLESVKKKVNTDRSNNEDTEYVLGFDDAAGTALTVTQTTLFEERALWKAYTSAQQGDYPERAGQEEEEWDNFVGDVIEDVGEEVEIEVGPRTSALRALENHVSGAVAYAERADAVEQGGVYVDAEPPEHDEVVVPREAIASITSTHEITDRALQAEITARGCSGPSLAGEKVSDSTTVNGRWQTFWYLSGEYFNEVADYREEPRDALDRMPANDDGSENDGDVVDDGSENDGKPDAGESVNGDEDTGSDDENPGGAPGKTGSYGGGE
jgi:hypothetical protein